MKVIGRAGTGVDNIDVKAATSKGILVVNTPGGNTISTGELAIAHILALARNIPQATAALKNGRWDRALYTGTELSGKVLGVIGVGKIGREVARVCREFGMQTIGYDPVLAEQTARNFGINPVSLNELFQKSDFITIHTPLTKETSNLINKETLVLCKKGVRIINCARGGIIDEAALLDALKSGHVAGASLDVLDIEPPVESSLELRKHPHVVMTPHLGASTFEAQERVAKAIADNVGDILNGGTFVGVVNAPDLGAIAKLTHILPYIQLAETIGSVQSQLLRNNKMGGLLLTLRGKDVADAKLMDIFKAAVIKGALEPIVEQQITLINAISVAEELGLKVLVNLSESTDASSGFRNSLSVEVNVEGFLNVSRVIEGTVFGKNDQRITKIDGFGIDLPPSENILLFNNFDVPGVLKGVAEKLSEANINIAHFSLGRKVESKQAMGVLVLDSPVPTDVLDNLTKYTDIRNLIQLHVTSNLDPHFRVSASSEQGYLASSTKPIDRPRNPEFSSGPCKKRPGYNVSALRTDVLGRSHRSKLGKLRLKKAIDDTRNILQIPDDYLIGIVPASDTGAYEMAMWNMLGERPVDACYWESFGKGWKEDCVKYLQLPQINEFKAEYGQLPPLHDTNPDHDVLFTYNGTTSGVKVPNLDWIPSNRKGLTFNDATSAAFAMNIDWTKVDITTYSWQKVLGGEGAHGKLIISS